MGFRRDNSGATNIEYGLIGALIAVAMMGAVYTLGQGLRDGYTMIGYMAGGDLVSMVKEFAFPQFAGQDQLLQQNEFTQLAETYFTDEEVEPEAVQGVYDEWDIDEDDALNQGEFNDLIDDDGDDLGSSW